MAMNRSQFAKQLQLGLNTVFGLEYSRYAEEWRGVFDIEKSEKAYEEDVLNVGLGAAPVKAEGAPVQYDAGSEAWSARYNHETIAMAFALTEEAEEDNLYGSVGARYSKAMARSFIQTKEVKGAAVLNNGFSAGATAGGDGVALFSTAHPLWNGATGSNTFSTMADLAEASLETALITISNMKDDRGIPVAARAMKLIGPPDLMFVAQRLLKSEYRVGTADNDINATRSMGMVPEGFHVMHRLTDTNAWFLKTDVGDGLKHFVRKPISGGMEGDFETGNARFKKRERYSFGFTDWRGAFGSSGAT